MTPASVIELRPPAPETAAAPSVRAIPTELSPATGCESASAAVAVAPAPLPELAAGQLWVVEISPHDGISALHRALITKGHVIIYDRSLEATVAALPPLGGYAEPASTAQTAQRCIRFTHDGWSVIRLVDRTTPAVRRSADLLALARCWQKARTTDEAEIFVATAGGHNARRLTAAAEIAPALAAAIAADGLIVVFAGGGPAAVPTLCGSLANGLAG